MAPPPSSPSWVILDREARACGGGLVLPEGADVSLELAAPPGVTVLTVSPRVLPTDDNAGPWVQALDPSAGLVLLGFLLRRGYLVFDIAAATASHVPYPKGHILTEDLGVIAAPGGGGNYMVVEFRPRVGDDDGILHCFSSETGRWEEKDVDNPLPSWKWNFDDVVSHDGKLWWVDNAAGLVFCDPFAVEPDMVYVPLDPTPEDDEDYLNDRQRVEMSPASNGAAPELSVRTLVDPETAEWTLEYAVSFADIWVSDSYKATELPEKAPRLMGAFVHPKNPDVVYFFLEEHLLGVDLRARKVVEKARVSCCWVLPWDLPPALSAGLSREGAANGANAVPFASPASPPSDDPNGA
ncbi:hypothetical protein E2562_020976 [Oryza meyeriana var. granulata]|uniref:DUF1618 domain-containing protein n=1 Tax=Oryza meyeriana var. granulata TaxID=110450 RepID=A0A6G1DXL0_9ORYZ|nr:hypothetical protein E2562_020976 [Oryza meyeriana var. granulata]